MRALAFSTLSEISAISGAAFRPVIDRSSTPLPMAPSGLMRSWQMRDPRSALKSSGPVTREVMGRDPDLKGNLEKGIPCRT